MVCALSTFTCCWTHASTIMPSTPSTTTSSLTCGRSSSHLFFLFWQTSSSPKSANNRLDTSRLQAEFPEVLDIKASLLKHVFCPEKP